MGNTQDIEHRTSYTNKGERWYFGAIASVVMGTVTLPLDTIKVQLQSERRDTSGKNTIQLVKKIVIERGCLGLYAGYSALVVAQIVYSLTRFNFYRLFKKWIYYKELWAKIICSGGAGAIAGVIGNPPGLITVRMQNDLKLPKEDRRKEEGPLTLMKGSLTGMYRGIGMTIGQLGCYDQIYLLMLKAGCRNTVPVHLFSGATAGAIAALITNPIDVAKTRLMTAEPGKIKGLCGAFISIAKEGPLAFYRGASLAFIRQILNTVIMWVTMEQLKMGIGTPPLENTTMYNNSSTVTLAMNLSTANPLN